MNITRLLWCILFAGITQSVFADRVTPNDRVSTSLNVRADPNTTLAIVGRLNRGESARLENSVPYWHEITLEDGTRGFVSKAWSEIIPDPAPTGQSIRLGAWNVKKLGHGSRKDYPLVAQVIEDNFDVLAVVEVMQKAGAHPGYDALMAALGSSWAGMVTSNPRPNTTAGHAEYYAIVYRTDRAEPCAGWSALQYFPDNDGSSSGTGADVFSRESAYGCFATRLSNGSTGFDFVLAGYHARWAEGDIEDIQAEVEHLDGVFAAMAQAQPGENDLIIAGDFNLANSDLAQALGESVDTIGTGSTLNSSGERTGNLYDHVLVHDRTATSEIIAPAAVLNVLSVANTPRAFFQTVSDHLPVRAHFRIDADDD